MASIKELKELALHSVRGTAPANFSNGTVDEALRGEMQNLASTFNEFMKNRYDIFEIVVTAVDEVIPKKSLEVLGAFAEIRTVADGQKALFKTSLGKQRAKKFLTQVGLSGLYETFRLDKGQFELGGMAIGGAARVDFERFIDGEDNLSDLVEIVMEGLSEAVLLEVQKALRASLNANRPAANVVIRPTFDGQEMFKLINVVRAYGSNAVIFAPPEFVGAMGADQIVPVTHYGKAPDFIGGLPGVYHPNDIDSIYRTGYVQMFRGTPIVRIPQSFVDENNEKTWIDPQMAYVLPAGKEKVVKVVFEGATRMWDFVNKDQSMEFHTYKKMGVAILTFHNWGIYQNTSIPQTMDDPYLGLKQY